MSGFLLRSWLVSRVFQKLSVVPPLVAMIAGAVQIAGATPNLVVERESGSLGDPVLNFGSVRVNTFSSPLSVVLKNTGDTPLTVSSTSWGDFPLNYWSAWPPYEILPLEQRTISFYVYSFETGDFTGALTINSDDPDTPTTTPFTLSANVIPQPDFSVSPEAVVDGAPAGGSVSRTLTLMNSSTTTGTFSTTIPGMSEFGYGFKRSDEEGGPTYSWVDISGTGIEVTGLEDENAAGPFPIGFDFPYFGETQTQFMVASNGHINLEVSSATSWTPVIPNPSLPNMVVAPFWADLNFDESSSAYYQNVGQDLIVQYNDVPTYSDDSKRMTVQAILKPSGEILFQYKDISGFDGFDQVAVGIENSDGSDGLLVTDALSDIYTGLAVRIVTMPTWLSITPSSGILAGESSQTLTVHLDGAGLDDGIYTQSARIITDEITQPTIDIPVTFHVGGSGEVNVFPDSIDFGTSYNLNPIEKDLQIGNSGVATLNINSISLPAGVTASRSTFSVFAGTTETIILTYQPAVYTSFSGNAVIVSDDTESPEVNVPLEGDSVAAPELKVTPQDLELQVEAGSSTTIEITVENVGTGTLDYSAIPLALFNEQAEWKNLTPPPGNVSFSVADQENGVIYAQQGFGVGFYMYNPADDTWSLQESAILGSSSAQASAVVSNGILYVTYPGDPVIGVYDTTTNSWSSFANPAGSGYPAITHDGSYLYVLQSDGTTSKLRRTTDGIAWESLADAPEIQGTNCTLLHHEGVIYCVVGGSSSSILSYSITDDTWTALPPAPHLLERAVLNANEPAIYAGFSNQLLRFDLESRQWNGNQTSLTNYPYAANLTWLPDYPNQLFGTPAYYYGASLNALDLGGWLSVEASGSLNGGQSENGTVTGDAAGLLEGQYTGAILFKSNDPAQSSYFHRVDLNVDGTPEAWTQESLEIEFPETYAGSASTDYVNIHNTGTADLHISGSESSAPAFSASPLTITPGTSGWVEVTFAPPAPGIYASTLNIISDAGTTPSLPVAVSGIATAPPVLNYAPSAIVATVELDSTGTANLLVGNSSITTLTVYQLYVSGDSYSVVEPEPYFFDVAPGTTQSVVLNLDSEFVPFAQTLNMSVVIQSNTPEMWTYIPLQVDVVGEGIRPKINVEPLSLSTTMELDTTRSVSIDVGNEGINDLTVNAYPSTSFYGMLAEPSSFTVEGGTTTTVNVVLDTTKFPESTTITQTLYFYSNDPAQSYVPVEIGIAAWGIGVRPRLNYAPDSIVTSLELDTTGSAVLEIGNTGAASLHAELFSDNIYNAVQTQPSIVDVAPGTTESVLVILDTRNIPSQTTLTQNLYIWTNDPGLNGDYARIPVTIRTTGIGERPSLSFSPGSIVASQEIGTTSTRTIDIGNAGTEEMTVSVGTPNGYGGLLSLDRFNFVVTPGTTETVTLLINTQGYLSNQTVSSYINLYTNDPSNGYTNIPVQVQVFVGDPPDQPQEPSPEDGSIDIPTTHQQFSWAPAARAQFYDFYLWKAADAAPVLPTAQGLTQPQYFKPGVLDADTTYSWKIRARNASGAVTGPTWTFITESLPDLRVANVVVPAAAGSGDSITVSWNIVNEGTGGTGSSYWDERVYLSTSEVYESASSQFLGSCSRVSSLDVGSSYTSNLNLAVPNGLNGTYYIHVITNEHNGLREISKANNVKSAPVEITLTPPSDLIVTDVLTSTTGTSGQLIGVTWTVKNVGPGTTNGDYWSDTVFISTDTTHTAVATARGTYSHSEALEPDELYTRYEEVQLPHFISGPYYVYVHTDINNSIYEHGNDDNNISRALEPVSVTQAPMPDLVPLLTDLPTTGAPGQYITVQAITRNPGDGAGVKGGYNLLGISSDAVYGNAGDRVLGSYYLPPMATQSEVTNTLTVRIPADWEPGAAHLVLISDYVNTEPENDEGNNSFATTIGIEAVDCNGNGVTDALDIASGTSIDCNNNGRPDECDLADGLDSDCNGNGKLDRCDIAEGLLQDCNRNGLSDSCEITSGTVSDCNGNGVPDSCDISSGNERDVNDNGIPDTCEIDYAATATVAISRVGRGTPVEIQGHAEMIIDGSPAVSKAVRIKLVLRETTRFLMTETDSNGDFITTFVPLPSEAGLYDVMAGHPLEFEELPEATFSIVGMQIQPASSSYKVVTGTPLTAVLTLRNVGEESLTDLNATFMNLPPSIDIQAVLPDILNGDEQTTIGLIIDAFTTAVSTANVTVVLDSAEGTTATTTVKIDVIPATPELLANPGFMRAAMLRGDQTMVEFEITNIGGAPANDLAMYMPSKAQAPWLNLVTSSTLGTLLPGEKTKVQFSLLPAEDLALGLYNGAVIVGGSNAFVNVPFEFTAVSNRSGDFRVYTVDEYTYLGAGSPPVVGTTVTLSNVYTSEVVATGETTDAGTVLFENLTEGYYKLECRANKHQTFYSNVFVKGNELTDYTAFLPRQLVTYTWTVKPTLIEDRYIITLESNFETHVPAPVVTVSPGFVDVDALSTGTSQINFLVENHGLIAARNFKFEFTDTEEFEFTPLIDQMDTIDALSSYTIPVKVVNHRGEASNAKSKVGTRSLSTRAGGCTAMPDARILYVYECGGQDLARQGHIMFAGVQVDCGFTLGGPSGGGGNPYNGSYGGHGGGVGGCFGPCGNFYVPNIWPEFPDIRFAPECEPCENEIKAAVADCLLPSKIGALGGCAYSCAKTAGEIFIRNGVGYRNLANCIGCMSDTISKLDCACNIWDATQCYTPPELRNNGMCPGQSGEGLGGPPPELEGGPDGTAGIMTARSQKPIAVRIDSVTGKWIRETRSVGDDVAQIHDELGVALGRMRAVANAYKVVFNDEQWFKSPGAEASQAAEQWFARFGDAVDEAGPGGIEILESEATDLMTNVPSWVTISHVQAVINRINLTAEYNSEGIFDLTDVPAGQSLDFVARDVAAQKWQLALSAISADEAEGNLNIGQGLQQLVNDLDSLLSGGSSGTCAQVRIQIQQEAVVSRQAFDATLEIDNADSSNLTNIELELKIRTQDGTPSNAVFGIRPPSFTGTLTNLDGAGVILGNTKGGVTYTLVPTSDAAADGPTIYKVGGTLSYLHNGTTVTAELFPDNITVLPDPSLRFHYFQEKVVYGDDPFTETVEPSVPFTLGLMVTNAGKGKAESLKISSSQPKIVENDKGLLVDFKIVGTQVGLNSVVPSLNVDLGSIEPAQSVVARWLLTSSLMGEFSDYTATYEHVDGLGDPRLSLIDSLDIHELIHTVRVENPVDDNLPDFLVNDELDPESLPDTLFNSNGTTAVVNVANSVVVDGGPCPFDDDVELTATVPSGFVYIRINNPGGNRYHLTAVKRSDGSFMRLGDNAWTTYRIIHENDVDTEESLFHLFDYNSSGCYTLYYSDTAVTDIAVSKRVSAENVLLKSELDYQIVVSNHGVMAATGIVVTDDVPSSLTVVDMDPPVTSVNGSVHLWEIPELPAGETTTISLTVTAEETGLITNVVEVQLSETDTNPDNNSDSVDVAVLDSADLSIVNVDLADPVLNDGLLTYTLTITNNGPSSAHGISVMDTLPAGVELISIEGNVHSTDYSGSVVSMQIDTLDVFEQEVITIIVSPKTTGTLLNSASVAAGTADPDTSNNSDGEMTDVLPAADLIVTQSVDKATLEFGQGDITLKLVVENKGPDAVTSATLIESVSENAEIVTSSSTHGECAIEAGSVICDLNILEAESVSTTTLILRPLTTGTVTSVATVTGLENDPLPDNNSSLLSVQVYEKANVLLESDFSTESNGWNVFLPATPGQSSVYYDEESRSIRVAVEPGNGARITGWQSTIGSDQILPYNSVGPNNYVRGKFAIYSGGQTTTSTAEIPNFRIRVAVRFAITSILNVQHHLTTVDPAGSSVSKDFRPSQDPAKPSIYRVDLDPIDVPTLVTSGTQEGIMRGFEAYAVEPQENGWLALSESSLATYPALPNTGSENVLIKTYNKGVSDFGDFIGATTPGAQFIGKYLKNEDNSYGDRETTGVQPLITVDDNGITLDTTMIPYYKIGHATVDVTRGNAEDQTNYLSRARIEPGKQYKVRFHATSTELSNRNAQVRFRVRTARFNWTHMLLVGGAFAAGEINNQIAREALPGVGSLNPDKDANEDGGWYSLLFQSPMNPDIRADMPGVPLSVSMPSLSAQDGPGFSSESPTLFRDIICAIDLVDGHGEEKGHVTLDKIEIYRYDQVPD